MSDQCGFEMRRRDVRPGFDDTVGETGDRDAGVRRPAAASGPHREGGVIRIVTRLPQRSPGLGGEGARKCQPAVFSGDVAHRFGLLGDVSVAQPVKLEEQGREHRVGHLGELVHRIDLDLVQQLDPRNRDPELDRGDDGTDGLLDRFEVASRRGNRLGTAMQSQRQFGNHTERAFRSNEQLGQVVAGR